MVVMLVGVLGCRGGSSPVSSPARDAVVESGYSADQCPDDVPATAITSVGASCTSGEVFLAVGTDGWAGGAWVYQTDGGEVPREEEHTLTSDAFDLMCEQWDHLSARLDAGVELWEPGRSTQFSCDDYERGTLTFAALVDDVFGNPVSCVVWGAAPQALLDAGGPSWEHAAPCVVLDPEP